MKKCIYVFLVIVFLAMGALSPHLMEQSSPEQAFLPMFIFSLTCGGLLGNIYTWTWDKAKPISWLAASFAMGFLIYITTSFLLNDNIIYKIYLGSFAIMLFSLLVGTSIEAVKNRKIFIK